MCDLPTSSTCRARPTWCWIRRRVMSWCAVCFLFVRLLICRFLSIDMKAHCVVVFDAQGQLRFRLQAANGKPFSSGPFALAFDHDLTRQLFVMETESISVFQC